MNFLSNGLVAIGVFIGVCIVIAAEFYIDFFGKSLNPSETMAATILGAAIALVGTLFAILANAEAQEKTRVERDQALVSGIFIKFQDMTNNFYDLRQHIRDSFEMHSLDDQQHPGLFVRALAGLPDPVQFSVDEKAIFLRLGNADIFNTVAQWAQIHNSLISAFETFAELKQEFTSKTPATISDGDAGTSTFAKKDFEKIAPLIAQLDTLVWQMQSRCERDYVECIDATLKLKDEMQNFCKIKLDLEYPE